MMNRNSKARIDQQEFVGANYLSPVKLAGMQGIERLFGDLTKCNIGMLTININPNFHVHCSADDEFNEIVKDIDIFFIEVRFDYIHSNIYAVNIDNSLGSIVSDALNEIVTWRCLWK